MPAKTVAPSAQAIADLGHFLEQHDYEQTICWEGRLSPQQENAEKASAQALEARFRRIAAGAPKPGDLAKMRSFVRGWLDQGAGEDAGWDALDAWVYGRQA